MRQRHKQLVKNEGEEDSDSQREPLEPIRTVERELTRPDGTTLKVQVPVYPPFRLEVRTPPKSPTRPHRPGKRKRAESS